MTTDSRDSEAVTRITSDVTLTGVVTGPIHVVGDTGALTLLGTAAAGVVVYGGAHACIIGQTEGLLVAPRATLTLTGTCHGAAINHGGHLDIDGTMDGPIIGHKGKVVVGPNAAFACSTITVPNRGAEDLWCGHGAAGEEDAERQHTSSV